MQQNAVLPSKRKSKRSMMWIVFVIGAVLSWGVYGAALHKGQTQLGNPLKPLLCVGVAYLFIGVLVPVLGLSSQGGLRGFDTSAARFGPASAERWGRSSGHSNLAGCRIT
jgi:drug/metabolite transporter (DMT)-like permease